VDDAKQIVPRCLTRARREAAFLDAAPPAWCIDMAKWPYHTLVWKAWLKGRANESALPMPDIESALFSSTRRYESTGERAAAIDAYEKSLTIRRKFVAAIPENSELRLAVAVSLNDLCWGRMIIGELQQALTDCNESLTITPNDANTLDSRGHAFLKIGQIDKAIADFDAALRMDASLASSLYGRGLAKLKRGDTAGGNADIAAARAIDPKIAERFAGYGIQ
jgi:tetratricopeptide (TPR) repeat protein